MILHSDTVSSLAETVSEWRIMRQIRVWWMPEIDNLEIMVFAARLRQFR